MLAAMSGNMPHSMHSGPAPPLNVEDDRLCAGCSRSVSSETGGVVVAFGNSLWHVDCFKCAKCGNQVNPDTNLLLLSDGSPVCASCYNCKVCNLPILDEAVMTGDDSYHAACFTCRSCKNRIDELVFAKTSQGFYCMKCHNERVARSRRHMAKQKQREKERQAQGSASSRNAAAGSSGRSRGEGEHLNGTSFLPDNLASSLSRPGYASGGSSSEGHSQGRYPMNSSQAGSRASASSNPGEASVADLSFMSTNSAADATFVPLLQPSAEHRSASPAPPAVSVTVSGPSVSQGGVIKESSLYERSRLDSPRYGQQTLGEPSNARPLSVDGLPPPPYSITPPPDHGSSERDSARSSTSYNQSGSGPASPSPSTSFSHEGSAEHGREVSERASSTTVPYFTSGTRERSESPSGNHLTEGGLNAHLTAEMEQSLRGKGNDDSRRLSSMLAPKASGSGTAALNVTKNKRDKRGSINPGLQLEASRLMNSLSERSLAASSSLPNSPIAAGSATASSPQGMHVRTHSPTTQTGGRDSPRVHSPLRDYFIGVEEDSSGSTSFYSPATSPQPLRGESPSSSRSTPATSVPSTASSLVAPSPPSAKEFLAKTPQRTDSLNGPNASAPAKAATSQIRAADSSDSASGRFSPLLNAPIPMLRSQRSFDERSGRLSPRKAEFGMDGGKRSRSVSPNPPDVPRSIESGTDTETDQGNDSDDITQSYFDRSHDDTPLDSSPEQPPALPPKDSKSATLVEGRSRSLSESSSVADGELYTSSKGHSDDSPSPISAVTERTSGFFIAPALPPMRFSMNGSEFRDILNNLGGPPSHRISVKYDSSEPKAENNILTIPEGKEEEAAPARTPTSIASTIMPSADMPIGEVTPKPLERTQSLKDRITSKPDALNLQDDEGWPDLLRASTSPTSPKYPESLKRLPHRASRSETAIRILEEPVSPHSSGESRHPTSPKLLNGSAGRERQDSSASLQVNDVPSSEDSTPRIPSVAVSRPSLSSRDSTELVTRRLKEVLGDASDRGSDHVKLNRTFVEAILSALEQKKDQVSEMSGKLDGMKRSSQMMMDGLTVAQEEYNQELNARRNAEAEVSRLKIELSGQAARLTALTSDDRRREVQKQLTQELSKNLTGLERDLSKLKVERDMTLAEVEELSASKSPTTGDVPATTVGRSLTMRLDNIKRQYQRELIPLTQEKEALVREIQDLKEERNIFLEETAVLNARNEELAQLNSEYERRLDSLSNSGHSKEKSLPNVQNSQSKASFDTWKARQAPAIANQTSTSTTSSATLIDEPIESRQPQKFVRPDVGETPLAQRTRIGLRWPGNKTKQDNFTSQAAFNDGNKGKKVLEHAFQQLSILRFARCDHCGDKMWGSQVRCTTCNLSVHVRCVNLVQSTCAHDGSVNGHDDNAQVGPPPPSMFGRDLVEQVRADSRGTDRFVPVIVEKCIEAVEVSAMDYEGVYRKTGGSGQSKAITSLFERGNYDTFDLCDSDTFNDISSVTSVLKNYFRQLPNPLLTYTLHESFVSAAGIRDPEGKGQSLKDLVKQLPSEHYYTLSCLMLHLHRVQLKADVNLMTARNLGVIFGPTLMRSRDPSREFADMAGKALTIEWLIENAPAVFPNHASA